MLVRALLTETAVADVSALRSVAVRIQSGRCGQSTAGAHREPQSSAAHVLPTISEGRVFKKYLETTRVESLETTCRFLDVR